jgi:hypothetical protein
VKNNTMRKILALAMVALLAMTFALAVVGCGQKAQESTTETTMPPPDAMIDTSGMMPDTGMTMPDTTVQH